MATTKDVDLYDVLGLTADASAEDIKQAYRKLARQTHPDVGGSAALFRLVGEAWYVLGDDGRKAVYDYDRRRAAGRAASGGASSRRADAGSGGASEGESSRGNRQGGERRQEQQRKQAPPKPKSRANVYGRVDQAANEAKFGARGTAGVVGERAVAAALDQVHLADNAFVFHDLVVNERGSNTDHVVLVGDRLLVIDAKAWRPGRYGWDARYGAWRDDEWFEWGSPSRTIAVADALRRQIGWAGPVEYVLAIAPSHGPASGLILDDYRPPGVTTVRVDQLAYLVASRIAAVAPGTPAAPKVVRGLVAATRDANAVRTPLAEGADADLTVPVRATPGVHVLCTLTAFAAPLAGVTAGGIVALGGNSSTHLSVFAWDVASLATALLACLTAGLAAFAMLGRPGGRALSEALAASGSTRPAREPGALAPTVALAALVVALVGWDSLVGARDIANSLWWITRRPDATGMFGHHEPFTAGDLAFGALVGVVLPAVLAVVAAAVMWRRRDDTGGRWAAAIAGATGPYAPQVVNTLRLHADDPQVASVLEQLTAQGGPAAAFARDVAARTG